MYCAHGVGCGWGKKSAAAHCRPRALSFSLQEIARGRHRGVRNKGRTKKAGQSKAHDLTGSGMPHAFISTRYIAHLAFSQQIIAAPPSTLKTPPPHAPAPEAHQDSETKKAGRGSRRPFSLTHVHAEVPLAVLLPLRPQPLALLRCHPLFVARSAAAPAASTAAATVPCVPGPGGMGSPLVVVRIVVLRSTAKLGVKRMGHSQAEWKGGGGHSELVPTCRGGSRV